jgi:8-oxo-dGTP diphosphatase
MVCRNLTPIRFTRPCTDAAHPDGRDGTRQALGLKQVMCRIRAPAMSGVSGNRFIASGVDCNRMAASARTPPFAGAKAAILIGDRLLVTQRDNRADIPYPDLWDLPGGGRDGLETPEETLFREVWEEVGLVLDPDAIIWRRVFPSENANGLPGWFFVVRLAAEAEADIVFGDEGQGWALEDPMDFISRTNAVPFLQQRLKVWLSEAG